MTVLTGIIAALREGGKPFLATDRDALLPLAHSLLPGCGVLAAALEVGSGRAPEVIGKPSATFFQTALERLGSQPEETVMMGDSIEADIAGGQAAGVDTMLLLSGRSTIRDVTPITPT